MGELRYTQNKMGYQVRRIGYIEQENSDLAALKKILSKDNPSKSPNSKSISSQNTIFTQLKKKITKKNHFLGPK